jgi:hypothetical protein
MTTPNNERRLCDECEEIGNFCGICKNESYECSCTLKSKGVCKEHINCMECDVCENIATHCFDCKSELSGCVCKAIYRAPMCRDHLDGLKCCGSITFVIYCYDCHFLKAECKCEYKSSKFCCYDCVKIKANSICDNCRNKNVIVYKCEDCHAFKCRECIMEDEWEARLHDRIFLCNECYRADCWFQWNK